MLTISLLFACSLVIVLCYELKKTQIYLFFCNDHKTFSHLEYILKAGFYRDWRKGLKIGEYHRLPYGRQHPWAIWSEYCVPIGYPRGQDEPILRFPVLIPRKKGKTSRDTLTSLEIFWNVSQRVLAVEDSPNKKGMNEFREFIVLQNLLLEIR